MFVWCCRLWTPYATSRPVVVVWTLPEASRPASPSPPVHSRPDWPRSAQWTVVRRRRLGHCRRHVPATVVTQDRSKKTEHPNTEVSDLWLTSVLGVSCWIPFLSFSAEVVRRPRPRAPSGRRWKSHHVEETIPRSQTSCPLPPIVVLKEPPTELRKSCLEILCRTAAQSHLCLLRARCLETTSD